MATEEEFDDVQLDDTSAGSKPALADEPTAETAAEAQNGSAERPIERPAEYVAFSECRQPYMWICRCCTALSEMRQCGSF